MKRLGTGLVELVYEELFSLDFCSSGALSLTCRGDLDWPTMDSSLVISHFQFRTSNLGIGRDLLLG